MSIIADILEALQADYPNVNIFDVDVYNLEKALTISNKDNVGLFIYVPEGTEEIHITVEDYGTGKKVTSFLVDVENANDLYEELYNFLQDNLTNFSSDASQEIQDILDDLSKNVINNGL